MLISAIFQGENGSLGYRSGEMYTLVLNESKYRNCPIVIERTDHTGLCPYQTPEMFFKNWRRVTKVAE